MLFIFHILNKHNIETLFLDVSFIETASCPLPTWRAQFVHSPSELCHAKMILSVVPGDLRGRPGWLQHVDTEARPPWADKTTKTWGRFSKVHVHLLENSLKAFRSQLILQDSHGHRSLHGLRRRKFIFAVHAFHKSMSKNSSVPDLMHQENSRYHQFKITHNLPSC